MSIANAFFVVLAFSGACSLAYFFGEFLRFYVKHRRIVRNRRWPRYQRVIGLPQKDERNWLARFNEELRR